MLIILDVNTGNGGRIESRGDWTTEITEQHLVTLFVWRGVMWGGVNGGGGIGSIGSGRTLHL